MDDVLAEIRKEQQQLRRQRDAIDERLAELDTVLRVLPTVGRGSPHVSASIETVNAQATTSATVTTIKDRIIAECEAILADGKPRPTRHLRTALIDRGVELNGKNQLLQVSAVLSREKSKFVASRTEGWTLRNLQKGEGPGVDAPEPSNSRQLPLASAVPQQPHP